MDFKVNETSAGIGHAEILDLIGSISLF